MKALSALLILPLAFLGHTFSTAQPTSGLPCPPYCGFKTVTFQTKGSQLLDPCGQPVVLKGVNKMAVFDYADPVGAGYLPQIAQTGANCVRLAWEMTSIVNGRRVVNPLSQLDQLITNAKANKLIPIVGLWDYTNTDDGGFAHLTEYVRYWTRPAMLALIRKHRQYLIINIGNETAKSAENGGNETIAADLAVYANAYKNALIRMRRAGIQVPLMIDGMDRGKSLHCFAVKGLEIARAHPAKNVIFSFHAYWPKRYTDVSPAFIQNAFAEVSTLPVPIVIGELAQYGAWPGDALTSPCSVAGLVDYEQFAQRANDAGMGWLAWEWGPGNQWKTANDCPQLDITTDGMYRSVAATSPTAVNAWGRTLLINSPISVKNTAQKTFFINSGFRQCPRPD